jgi:anti-sigma regulatory factor (Ser/Thr protein kinase)
VPTVELRFAALPAHVRTARLLAASLARRTGVEESVIDEVKLAVGEACARAVGINQRSADEVLVELSDDDAVFVVTVHDKGRAAAVPDQLDVEDLASGDDVTAPLPPGFGLAVIAGLVDDLDVSADGDGTVVRMSWSADLERSAPRP